MKGQKSKEISEGFMMMVLDCLCTLRGVLIGVIAEKQMTGSHRHSWRAIKLHAD